jgi:4-alpha-glucanotransferase
MVKPHRASGILLHVTSLPSLFGIGDLGPESYKFADLLAQNKQNCWSILPLSPTRLEAGNSPYQISSAFAGNPLLISPEKLVDDCYLPKKTLRCAARQANRVNYNGVYLQKGALLKEAYANFEPTSEFERFCDENDFWLQDYAVYSALWSASGKPWYLWPAPLRKRDFRVLAKKALELNKGVEFEKFVQFLFFNQWQSLKEHCKYRQISILGDMPFYVAYDSVDVWVHPELFSLTVARTPKFVGGVPPDYFSSTGQLWGNPVYNWKKLAQNNFEWWIQRIGHNLTLYDKLRLDHFRGFVAYWQVPASAKTAKTGQWIDTPSDAFFDALKTAFPSLPFIAEDLGYIDAPVKQAITRLDIPGMRVLLFAFDGSVDNPHLPKNHPQNCVVYTGTHDTNTARGWFETEATTKDKRNLSKLAGQVVTAKNVSSVLAKLALSSAANLSIIPMQDVLGLGSEARMNYPGKSTGNWVWRLTSKQLTSDVLATLSAQTVEAQRTGA